MDQIKDGGWAVINPETGKSLERSRLEKIYEGLNDSERFGVQFGMFPARLMSLELTKDDIVELMEIRKEQNTYDINKHPGVNM